MNTPLTFTALGTTWWIELFDEVDNQRRDRLTESITALVHSIEARFSRFLPDSLTTTLNTKRTLTTSDLDLLALITLGKQLYTTTNEVFNCLLGEHLESRGYDADYSFTPTTAPTTFPDPLTDIIINDDTITLTQGKLDLGGFGKGWAIDQVAELLTSNGITEFLINAGGDMYGTSEHGQPITIYLEHPYMPDTLIGSTTLCKQGFAASSRFKRQWKHTDTTYNHIVDTQTVAESADSAPDGVFVKAPTAVMADAFATTGLLTTPTTLLALAATHQLGLAFYTNATSSLASNQAFTNPPDGVS